MELVVNIMSTIAILVYGALAVLSFVSGGLSLRSIFFSVVMFAGVAWTALSFVNTTTTDQLVTITKAIFLILNVVYYFLMLFSLTLLRHISSKKLVLLASTGAALSVITVITVMFVPASFIFSVLDISDGVVTMMPAPSYMIASLVPMSFLLISVAAQVIAYRRAQDRQKKILRNTLISVIVLATFTIIFNVVVQDHDWHWLGAMSVLIVGPIFYSSVIQHTDDDL